MQQNQYPQMNLLNNIRKAGSDKVYLKLLLTGPEETGKSTSVLYGAEKPLLVFDLEQGTEIFSHNADFDIYPSDNPAEILAVTQELLYLQQQGYELPYKSFFIDSGTDLYKRVIKDEIATLAQIKEDPNKRSLDPKEYSHPNSVFYDIIKNFKKLKADFYISAHAATNYMKNSFMAIDPNEPVKADCHKDLAHEMDVHIMFKKIGPASKRNIKAEIKKSRLDDKDKNPLLPAVIEKVDNNTLIPMLREFASRDKGFKRDKPNIQNIVQANSDLSNNVDEILTIFSGLQMDPKKAEEIIAQETNNRVTSPHSLNEEESFRVLAVFRRLRDSMNQNRE